MKKLGPDATQVQVLFVTVDPKRDKPELLREYLPAFDKSFLARPIGDGVMSLGIPIGFGVIVVSIILTGVYVVRANGEFDLTRA